MLAVTDLSGLETIRDRCDKLLGAGSGCDAKKKMFNAILYVIEKVGCAGGVQCEGLTSTLLADKEYQKDVTRLALQYLSANDCRAEISVAMKVLSTAVQLHANSEIRARQQEVKAQMAAPAAAKKVAEIDAKYGSDPSHDNIA
jgi:hypothetical protein